MMDVVLRVSCTKKFYISWKSSFAYGFETRLSQLLENFENLSYSYRILSICQLLCVVIQCMTSYLIFFRLSAMRCFIEVVNYSVD